MKNYLEVNDILRTLNILAETTLFSGLSEDRELTIETYAHLPSIGFIGSDTLGFTIRDTRSEKLFSRSWKAAQYHPAKFQARYPMLYSLELAQDNRGVELEIGMVMTYEQWDDTGSVFDKDGAAFRSYHQVLDDSEKILILLTRLLGKCHRFDYTDRSNELKSIYVPDLLSASARLALDWDVGSWLGKHPSSSSGIKLERGTMFKIDNMSSANLWGTAMRVIFPIKDCGADYRPVDDVSDGSTRPDSNSNS